MPEECGEEVGLFLHNAYLYRALLPGLMLFPLLLLVYLALPVCALWRFHVERQHGLHSGYRFSRKHLWWGNDGPSSIATARVGVQAMLLAALGTIPLVGLPGAVVIEAFIAAGLPPQKAFDGDAA